MNLRARWLAMKSKKADLILFFAGLALIALALLWRTVVAPALRVVPTDIDMMRFYDGAATDYLTEAGGSPRVTEVSIQERVYNPLGRSTSSVAVLAVDSALIDKADNSRLLEGKSYFAIDRRNARQVRGHGSDADRSGYYLIFPFDTPRTDLRVWDPLTGKAQNARYSGTRTVDGVETYRFMVSYGGQPIPPPEGMPKTITGAQAKSLTGRGDLPVADGARVEVSYRANNSYELLVEPRMGNLVSRLDERQSIFMDIAFGETRNTVAQVVRKLDFSETGASQAGAATFAAGEIEKWDLQSVYLPLGFLLLGIACSLIGFFVDTRKAGAEKA